MKTINFASSVHMLLFCALFTLLISFGGVIIFDVPLFDLQYFFFVKLTKFVTCLSALLYWNFIRQSNEAEHTDSDFRRWQVGALLLIQSLDGALFLIASTSFEWYWISSVNLFLSACLLYSLYYSYLLKRIADVIVLSSVGIVFTVLISYSLNGNVNVISYSEVDNFAALLSLAGCVLMLSTSIIGAQYKIDDYSEFELLPVLLVISGYLEIMGREQYWFWWGGTVFQLLFVVALVLLIVRVNRQSSVDWSMFDAGLNMSPHPYFCSDMDGNIRFVNDAYKSLFDIPDSQKLTEISHPLYTHPLEQSISEYLDKNRNWEGETVLINDAGKVTSVHANVSVIELNGVQYQHGWFQDIDEKKAFKEAENEILDKLERLSLDLMEKQEEERSFFAKELHDEIGQGLTLLKIQHQLPEPDQDLIRTVLSELIDKVRNLSLNLRPAILDDMGLSAALNWLIERQNQFSELAITTDISSDIPRLNDKLEISVFRIAQEAFTNIHKYSHADHVNFSCKVETGYLQLTIADNGVGFDIDAKLSRANQGQSLGLLSLKERAFSVNGLVDIHSTPETGTKIELRAPIDVQVIVDGFEEETFEQKCDGVNDV